MAFKLFLLLAVVAVASAQYGHEHGHGHDEHHDAPAHYQFAYGVKDGHTGDIKEQEEKRDGDHVSGHYSVVEADGTRRVVHYADNGHGFEAQVQREGHAHHAEPAHHDAHHGHVYAAAASHGGASHGHHAESYANQNTHHTEHKH